MFHRSPAKRRRPRQRRALQTVEAVLDGTLRVLERRGADGVTTNRIAEAAGVSIGSVYQYFPDKQAIFAALHDRHVEQIRGLVERTLLDHAAAPLEALVAGLVRALVRAHAAEPELHTLLSGQGAHDGTGDRRARLRAAFRLALAARAPELALPADLEPTLFVLAQMVDALTHGVVQRRPARVSLAAAQDEAVRAIVAYLRAGAVTSRTARPGSAGRARSSAARSSRGSPTRPPRAGRSSSP